MIDCVELTESTKPVVDGDPYDISVHENFWSEFMSPAVHESTTVYIEKDVQIRIGAICWELRKLWFGFT